VHAVGTAWHTVAKAANAVAALVKNHAATIASFVVSTAVFVGCGAGDTLANAPEDAGLGTRAPASCGGARFTAATKILLATGTAIPISRPRPGQKVLATNTHTGKTRPKKIAAVLVHHDTNRYNLTISTGGGHTAVIHTTRNHLFWSPNTHRWTKAAALKYGTHLTTPTGTTATALGGHNAHTRTGWMWDLTIPGDHDFYVVAGITATLAHNCGSLAEIAGKVQAVLKGDPMAYSNRTVAIMRTSDNNLIAANAGHAFTNDQITVLARYGIGHIPFEDGVHAEVQLLNLAARSTDTLFPLVPKEIGASWQICPEICRPAIENTNFGGNVGRISTMGGLQSGGPDEHIRPSNIIGMLEGQPAVSTAVLALCCAERLSAIAESLTESLSVGRTVRAGLDLTWSAVARNDYDIAAVREAISDLDELLNSSDCDLGQFRIYLDDAICAAIYTLQAVREDSSTAALNAVTRCEDVYFQLATRTWPRLSLNALMESPIMQQGVSLQVRDAREIAAWDGVITPERLASLRQAAHSAGESLVALIRGDPPEAGKDPAASGQESLF
jgi:hypothetical protein